MSGVRLIDRSSSEVTRATASKPLIAAAKAMREPDLVQRIEAIGMVIRENGTAHYAQMIQNESALYARLVRDLK